MAVPAAFTPGDITVVINNVTNGVPGSFVVQVSTTKEELGVSSQVFNIFPDLSNVIVELSNQAAGASGVIYTVSFGTALALAAGDSITVEFPSGTGFGAMVPQINSTPCNSSVSGTTITLTLPGNVPAGGVILRFENVCNPAPGGYELRLSTSKAPTLVNSQFYNTGFGVSKPAVELDNNVAYADYVTYTLRFATSVGLHVSDNDCIAVMLPRGMYFTDSSSVSATINSMPAQNVVGLAIPTGFVTGFAVPGDIPAGNITVTLSSLHNPGVGAYQLNV